MATGRVITGFSKPYVAIYENGGYTGLTPLARGVDVSIDIDTADDNVFYADNVQAESASGLFSSGTLTLTVDGLKDAARAMIMGLPAVTDNMYVYDDRQAIPYCGVGFIVRYMEDGVTSFVPYILTKVQFAVDGLEAATQEEEIDWQTQELTANIFRDDSEHHAWRKVGVAQTTESAAEAVFAAAFPAATAAV